MRRNDKIKNIKEEVSGINNEIKEIDFDLILKNATWNCYIICENNNLEQFGFETKDAFNKDDLPKLFSHIYQIAEKKNINLIHNKDWNITQTNYRYEPIESYFNEVFDSLSSSTLYPGDKKSKDLILYSVIDGLKKELFESAYIEPDNNEAISYEDCIIQTERDRILSEYKDKIYFNSSKQTYEVNFIDKKGKRIKISGKNKNDIVDNIIKRVLYEENRPAITTIIPKGQDVETQIDETNLYSDPYISFDFLG